MNGENIYPKNDDDCAVRIEECEASEPINAEYRW